MVKINDFDCIENIALAAKNRNVRGVKKMQFKLWIYIIIYDFYIIIVSSKDYAKWNVS